MIAGTLELHNRMAAADVVRRSRADRIRVLTSL
jgi:hypothetical protein